MTLAVDRPRRKHTAGPADLSLAARLDPRANSLNAIRLVLASLVILSHSWVLGGIYGRTPSYFGETWGAWSVFAFFVLSGYLVTGSRLNTDFVDYIKRRVLRIYPGFVVCLLATVLIFGPIGYYQFHRTLHGYFSTPTAPVDYVLANISMRMVVYHVAGTPSNPHDWTGSLWTLYFEFLCYVMVGLLAVWGPFRRRPIVAVTLLALVSLARIELTHIQRYAQSPDVVNLLRLVPYFLAGSVLYLLREKIPCRWWGALIALAVCVVILEFGGNRYICLCALPMGYLLLYLGAVVPIALGRRNDISYGMYMYGYPVEQLLRLLKIPSHLVYTILAIACTVPIAMASWFLVERPAMRLGRHNKRIRPADPPSSRESGDIPLGGVTAPTSRRSAT